MNFINISKAALCSLSILITSTAVIHTANAQPYWKDSNGEIIHTGFNECWRTSSWTAESALPECEGGTTEAVAASPKSATNIQPATNTNSAMVNDTDTVKVSNNDKKTITLSIVEFETDNSRISSSSKSDLDDVAKTLMNNDNKKLFIAGHADDTGGYNINLWLSKQRAEAVKAYLISKGVTADSLTTKGYGSDKPIADNATADGRARNRRVEIILQ